MVVKQKMVYPLFGVTSYDSDEELENINKIRGKEVLVREKVQVQES